MHDNDSISFDSFYFETPSFREGPAIAVWAVTMTMLIGAVMVAGVTLTAVRLRVVSRF
jgi:hypothetical protein